jgi:FAS-associated factor 2
MTITSSNPVTIPQSSPMTSPPSNPLTNIAKTSWKWFFGLLSYLTSFIPVPLSSYLGNLANSPPSLLAGGTGLDPNGASTRFLLNYEQRYGRNHPEFFQGTYNQALDSAKRELKYFLAIVQSDGHDDTDVFNRTTLGSERVIQYLRENNFLVWAGSVREPEGYQVSNLLQASKFPFCALVAPQGSMMKVFDRIEGIQSADELIGRLQRKISVLQAQLEAVRRERLERDLNRRIREEQDAAYQASLQADQEKERRVREAREEEARLQQEKEELLVKQQQAKELAERIRNDKVSRKTREIEAAKVYWKSVPEPATGAKLSIKLPNGERVVRKFAANDTIKVCFSRQKSD